MLVLKDVFYFEIFHILEIQIKGAQGMHLCQILTPIPSPVSTACVA